MQKTVVESLALTSAAFHGEWWRLWTAHVVHYSQSHALLNAIAIVPALALAPSKWKLFWWAVAMAPVLSIALLLTSPGSIEYRGASALILGAWIFGSLANLRGEMRPIAMIALLLAALKLFAETAGYLPWSIEVESSLAAHWCGAVAGAIGGIAALLSGSVRASPLSSENEARDP